jgi:hypothetical protein
MMNKARKNVQKITPFLWFDGQAEDAAKFYTSIFKDSRIGRILRYGEEVAKVSESGQLVGSVLTIEFEIEGQKCETRPPQDASEAPADHSDRRSNSRGMHQLRNSRVSRQPAFIGFLWRMD